MKERKLMLLALLVTMMLPMNMFAQKDDFGMWFTVGAEKNGLRGFLSPLTTNP